MALAHGSRSRVHSLPRQFAVAASMLYALAAVDCASAADAAAKGASASTPAATPAETAPQPVLPSLAEMLIEAERTDTLEHEVRKRFGDLDRLAVAEQNLAAVEAAVADASHKVETGATERLQVLGLIELAMEIRTFADRVRATTNALDARARAYDSDLDRIGESRKQWTQRIEAARQRDAPAQVLQRIEAIPQRLDALAREVTARRNANLVVLDRAARLRGRMNTMLNEATERRDRLIESLSTARADPLWSARPKAGAAQLAHAWITTEVAQLRGYVVLHWVTLTLIAGLSLVLCFGLQVAARKILASDTHPDFDAELSQRLFRWPLMGAVALALAILLWQAPEAPIIFYSATLTLLFFVCAILARVAGRHEATLTLYTLAAAILLNWFQAGIDALPFSGRLLLMIQCAAVATALAIDLRRGRLAHPAQLLPPPLMRMLALGAMLLLGAAIVASVIGSVGLARQLRDGVLRTLGFAVIINVLMRLLHGLVLALVLSWASQWSRIVQYRASSIRTAMRVSINLLAVMAWVFGSLLSFQALGFFEWAQATVRDAKIEIGTVSISAEAVLLCAAVLVATWLIIKLTRLILELELLSRVSVSSATSFVISASIRYLLTVAGLILAMAALGIDFSKVTLLVSAIGIGIGFGLQNVVNNFVSGLLLLGERVINVGDTVQVGSLTGVVRRIGVRSSTVRTFLGAEVIVPNSDLTSKEVVNFTLSDRHRRLDIQVGVGYGSDPEKVAQLLIAAAKAQPEVLLTPAPLAAFIGFGDSSLDFRLQAWIANYENGLAVETALRVAILAALRDAGIEIPFPQRDVNIRAVNGVMVPQTAPSA